MGGKQSQETKSYWRDTELLQEQQEGAQLLDSILESYRPKMGADFFGYRNHCHRVFCFALYLIPNAPSDKDAIKKIAIALAFHDLGIWTASTVDYIDPSRRDALQYLEANNLLGWKEEVDVMIERHHQILQGSLPSDSLAEVIRRADLVDFSLGFVKNGLPASVVERVRASYANEGFHWRLVQLAAAWFIRHPLNPAPMMRLTS
jgi:hypothetical protein|mmetsp:Transcript_15033/g.16283  ORF Transcript_15033/g.16283 Transcript_15033/m.16283 type:complete len:204 (-) Transcript_15033:2437-3048(-)